MPLNMQTAAFQSYAKHSPHHNLFGKKALKRLTQNMDIIDATKYKNRSVPIIRKTSNKLKPWDSINTNITLTQQSLLDDMTHKSKDK